MKKTKFIADFIASLFILSIIESLILVNSSYLLQNTTLSIVYCLAKHIISKDDGKYNVLRDDVLSILNNFLKTMEDMRERFFSKKLQTIKAYKAETKPGAMKNAKDLSKAAMVLMALAVAAACIFNSILLTVLVFAAEAVVMALYYGNLRLLNKIESMDEDLE